jgi:hypothetical protein
VLFNRSSRRSSRAPASSTIVASATRSSAVDVLRGQSAQMSWRIVRPTALARCLPRARPSTENTSHNDRGRLQGACRAAASDSNASARRPAANRDAPGEPYDVRSSAVRAASSRRAATVPPSGQSAAVIVRRPHRRASRRA